MAALDYRADTALRTKSSNAETLIAPVYMAMGYAVRSLPTIIVTDDDGIPVQTRTGSMSVSALEDFIRGARA